MSSPATAADHSNTKTEDEMTAFHRKRSRRVSFAENTSIHIFYRDDEFETPPDPEPPSPPSDDQGFTERDSDSKQFSNNEDDETGPRMPFIRVVGSPSSGGSTVSATSNDEDNFFGPVSANFIRRDLLDCAISDDNHDQTMDSTAFSVHFRSLARSDIEGDLKTSTSVDLSFEEKTPTSSSLPSNTRNSMQLTLVNKATSQPVSTSKLSTGSQSNDMSLVGEYHDKYDYGKLSPAMDPLLAEDHNDMQMVSHIPVIKSPIKAKKQNGNEPEFMDYSFGKDNKMQGITSHKELVSVTPDEMGVADEGSKLLPSKQTTFGVLFNASDIQASKSLSPNQSIRDALTVKTNESVKAFGINSSLEFLAPNQGTPLNHMSLVHQLTDVVEKEKKSPLVGSITHLTNRPSLMLLNGVGNCKSPGTVTPFNKSASVIKSASVSSLQKSISKLRILEASPFSAALAAKLLESNSGSLVGLSKMTPLGNLWEKEGTSANIDGNKTEAPIILVTKENCAEVPSQLVLPLENTRSGEHMHQTVLRSSDIRYGFKDDENKIGSLQTFNSSPKMLKKATPVSPHRDEQPIQHESVEFGQSHVGGLATASDGMGSLYNRGRETSTPVNVAGSNTEEMMHERKDFLNDANINSEAGGNLNNVSNNIEHEIFQSISRGSDISIGRTADSLVLNGRMDEQSFHKNLAKEFGRSPLNKEMYSMLHNGNNGSSHAENLMYNVSSIERKRKAEHVTTDKIAKIKTSSNSDLKLPSDTGMLTTGPNLEHLTEIHSRLFKETLLPHSVDKMNLHAIDRLVDILGQLKRSKTYQLLSNEVRSQDRRAAETKLILCKFVHEQAKLQLMRMKQERLLKNVHSLASGIQESEKLKLNLLQKSLDTQVTHQDSLPDNVEEIQECQADKDKVTSMTLSIKDTNRRISDLTKSFHILCKMKGEPKTADTVDYANAHLMKKAHCQILRKDLQLWVIDNLNSSKDHHDVVLNYLDLMFQRLTITAGVLPSISVSNTLNQMNIQKIFKDMDASTAFGFVFDTSLVQKHFTDASMAQEAQMTSFILGNLVDVMEEIQLAKIELKNLIYARFCTSSGDSALIFCYPCFDSTLSKRGIILL
ncbi:hypothetical protein R6Q57_006427 [Mikania cordata]